MPAPISFMRGSLIIFSFAASRAARSGYSNQEKTTASSSFAWTDLRKSVTLPSGTSSLQLSTMRVAPSASRAAVGVGGYSVVVDASYPHVDDGRVVHQDVRCDQDDKDTGQRPRFCE